MTGAACPCAGLTIATGRMLNIVLVSAPGGLRKGSILSRWRMVFIHDFNKVEYNPL